MHLLFFREGMLNLVSAYKHSDSEENSNLNNSKMVLLHSLLSQYLDNEEPMVRFVAVRFIASVFPPIYVKAKYLLLIATADSKEEIASEALKSLYEGTGKHDIGSGSTKEQSSKLVLPSFQEMMTYVNNEVNTRMAKPQKCYSQGNHILPYPVSVYKEVMHELIFY